MPETYLSKSSCGVDVSMLLGTISEGEAEIFAFDVIRTRKRNHGRNMLVRCRGSSLPVTWLRKASVMYHSDGSHRYSRYVMVGSQPSIEAAICGTLRGGWKKRHYVAAAGVVVEKLQRPGRCTKTVAQARRSVRHETGSVIGGVAPLHAPHSSLITLHFRGRKQTCSERATPMMSQHAIHIVQRRHHQRSRI
jgi:hypothetical protein